MGYKNGISLGLLIIVAGAFMFYPVASSRIFFFFLLVLFVMGTGLAVLQTASNPYVVVISPRESAATRIGAIEIVFQMKSNADEKKQNHSRACCNDLSSIFKFKQ